MSQGEPTVAVGPSTAVEGSSGEYSLYISSDSDDEEEDTPPAAVNFAQPQAPPPSAKRHKQDTRTTTSTTVFTCGQCGQEFNYINMLKLHRRECFPDPVPNMPEIDNDRVHRFLAAESLNGASRYYRFTPSNPPVQPIDFITSIRPEIEDTVDQLNRGSSECKIHPVIMLRLLQVDPKEGNVIRTEMQAFSRPATAINTDSFVDNMLNDLIRAIEQFIKNGSNWIVETVKWFDLRVVRYHSAPDCRGRRFVNLPPKLRRKKACVNVDNLNGSDCFKYAVLSILHHDEVRKDYRFRPWAYARWANELNFGDLTFPITAGDIPRFEKLVSIFIVLFCYITYI